jgi:ABC-type multidrug transport system fused ATPase/permease subunit
MELEDDPFDQQKGGVSGDENALKPQTTNSAGRLANLMAADVDAIYRSRDAIQIVAGVPAGTIISLIGMYQMLGWPSLVGTVVLLLSSPMSMWLGRMMFKVQRVVRKAQDSRISLVTEYLASIRAIKYFAWEDAVTEKIASARSTEQKQLWRVAILQVVINQITQITPFLALLLMFGLHVGVSKQRLDASTAFTSAYLVKNIRRNIAMVSYMFRNFAATAVSLGRIDKYFENTVPLREVPIGPVRIANGCFRRNKKATFSLQDISIDFVQGGLNVVTGQSGSGKTTLLLAILGETYIEGGIASRPDDVAFASQSSWLQNQSIEANILFESPMDRSRYDRVIEACCLDVDLKEIADGDQSLVGENGSSLSGGQRARVALGRALYSKAPLLLLDDIFSALDAKTAAGVWKYCFCTDFLKGRTIILVTQVPWISEQADLAIHLENGRVKSLEPHIGVDRKPITVAEVLGGNDEEEATESEMQPTLDPLNEPTKIIEDKTSKDVVNQEMKASGRITRLTSTYPP